MKMSFRYFPIRELLEQVVAEMQSVADQQSITLSLNVFDPTLKVLGDRERLKQVMINLIDNAIKYNHSGGRVDISVAASGSEAMVSVTDTGVGIPPEDLPRIFERFYRVDKERSREAGGTGLGLAIVKHIIEAHDSTVGVESNPGSGSVFSFRLRM
jgi:two-component system, OmpR family, phosphate regulon sensor histidine kinase PhoR